MESRRGQYRFRTYRPDVDAYWRVLRFLAGPGGDVVALHERCRDAGVAPKGARRLSPMRLAVVLGVPPPEVRHG